jgi:hypothetical protein
VGAAVLVTAATSLESIVSFAVYVTVANSLYSVVVVVHAAVRVTVASCIGRRLCD